MLFLLRLFCISFRRLKTLAKLNLRFALCSVLKLTFLLLCCCLFVDVGLVLFVCVVVVVTTTIPAHFLSTPALDCVEYEY